MVNEIFLHNSSNKLCENKNSKNVDSLQQFFDFLVANIARSKMTFSLVFLSLREDYRLLEQYGIENNNTFIEVINEFLSNQTRDSDLCFTISDKGEWVFLLPYSKQEDAKYFLKRVFTATQKSSAFNNLAFDICFSACIMEISQSKVEFLDAFSKGKEGLQCAIEKGAFEYEIIENFKENDIEEIKVSIIDDDEFTQNLLQTLLKRTAMNFFQLEISTFHDGKDFLNSSWYLSAHTHIVLLNDTLSKKSGIEVIHKLRSMPNHTKYIIFMFSKGKSEEDIIYAYENGVDEYISKPFNVKILEAKLKNWLRRLR